MKYIVFAVMLVTSAFASSVSYAGVLCGSGKILAIKEGGWNANDLLIKVDYSVEGDAVGGLYHGWIRFSSAELNEVRFKGIKAIAYMALSANKVVRAYTHTSTCGLATELAIFDDGVTPH